MSPLHVEHAGAGEGGVVAVLGPGPRHAQRHLAEPGAGVREELVAGHGHQVAEAGVRTRLHTAGGVLQLAAVPGHDTLTAHCPTAVTGVVFRVSTKVLTHLRLRSQFTWKYVFCKS